MKNLLDVLRKARALLASVFLLSAYGVFITDLPKVPQPAFVVEMRSDTNGVAQLFFDVGRGINESDSVRLPINAATSYRDLRFSLPGARIRALQIRPDRWFRNVLHSQRCDREFVRRRSASVRLE